MSLEEFIPDIESQEGSGSAESSREASEKYKEATKKSSAWIKRIQKDEKKAKKHDFLLASFLVKIILDKKYDFLLDKLFKSLNSWFSSNFVLWVLSLINIEISHKIRELSSKEKINFDYVAKKELTDFHDRDLDLKLKNRINFWLEDILDVTSIDYSSLQTENLSYIIDDKREVILEFVSLVFSFFFNELNINISKSKSDNYSDFIISEIKNSLKSLDIEKI